MTGPAAERFQVFPQFNDPTPGPLVGSRSRLGPWSRVHFPSDRLADRFMRALADRRALPIKEALEAFEFFWRVRKKLRAPRVADLMCGHGLVGVLFAVYEREVEEVVLLDRRRPASFDAILDAAAEVAPWAPARVRYEQTTVRRGWPQLAPGASIVGVHACGGRTDACIDAALGLGGALAVMPCCYADAPPGPWAVSRALGNAVAWDVHRTYRLEAGGLRVRWTVIPAAITPMNRVLVAERRADQWLEP